MNRYFNDETLVAGILAIFAFAALVLGLWKLALLFCIIGLGLSLWGLRKG